MIAAGLSPALAARTPMPPRPLLRPRKPLTQRELALLFARVKARVLKGGEPFGVFAIKRGRGRVFRLISVNHADFTAQMRVDRALRHWIATYDGTADLAHVWDDLSSFDRR